MERTQPAELDDGRWKDRMVRIPPASRASEPQPMSGRVRARALLRHVFGVTAAQPDAGQRCQDWPAEPAYHPRSRLVTTRQAAAVRTWAPAADRSTSFGLIPPVGRYSAANGVIPLPSTTHTAWVDEQRSS